MTAKKQPVAMRFLPHRITQDGKISSDIDLSVNNGVQGSFEDSVPKQPSRSLLFIIHIKRRFGDP